MKFSEYIAVLSGDTSLLEKSKLEKKVAVMESLKTAHYKEISRTRQQVDYLQEEKNTASRTLGKLTDDEGFYKSRLQYDSEDTKANPIQLDNFKGQDTEAVGKHIIGLYRNWKPTQGEDEVKQIGTLYGFSLFIRRERETYKEEGLFQYRYSNSFYAQRGQDGIKYNYSGGTPNTDNPKLAARYFLNAIDRVEHLKDKYQKSIRDIDEQLPGLQQLTAKPFGKEPELQHMKAELSRLEKEIAQKIQDKQLGQAGQETHAITDKPVIQMDTASNANNSKIPEAPASKQETDRWQQQGYAQMRRSSRMKF
jgi:hypothetical protein